MTWTAYRHRGEFHVVPDYDTYRHVKDRGCACCPRQDAEEEAIFVHHAWDQREAFERGVRLPS